MKVKNNASRIDDLWASGERSVDRFSVHLCCGLEAGHDSE